MIQRRAPRPTAGCAGSRSTRGVPITFGVLGAGDPQIWRDQLDLLDDTAAEGGRMFAQTHCRGVSVLLSFKTNLPFDRLPEWAELRALPLDAQAELLARPRGARATRPRRERGRVRPSRAAPRPASRATTGSTCSSGPTGRNPTLAELSESSRPRSGRDHDRPRPRVEVRGLLPAVPGEARQTGDRGDAQPPAHGDDVLGLRRPRQPDHGLVASRRICSPSGCAVARCSRSRRRCG